MRDLFDKEFQKEMDDFFDYIDHEVLGKPKEEPYDHSIDTIDPDEPPIPGPPYDSYGYNDEDDDDVLPTSDCCGAELIIHDQLCGDCKEHV
tara:strand:+ start:118 stop:390 length:273 start_codon:yes stop_codon:yes gene_type:complete